jgi:tetratricopeptide (TPR) repeat protein
MPHQMYHAELHREWNLPNIALQRIQTLDVIIVPFGSKALWTSAGIEKELKAKSDQIASQRRHIANLHGQIDQLEQLDLPQFMNELAKKYGFKPKEVKAAFDEWARSIGDIANDHVQALRDFYNQKYIDSGRKFTSAAERGLENAADEFRLSGNSYIAGYDFRDALESYGRSMNLISRIKQPEKFAAITNLLSIAKVELGTRTEGEEGQRLLSESIVAYHQNLLFRTREQNPLDWAATQNNLGIALQELGIRAEGPEATRLLSESVAAYRQALLVRSRENLPQDWAVTQNNLGNSLQEQGLRAEGADSARLLNEAVAAYQQALLVYTREQLPEFWATTQTNLAQAFFNLKDAAKAAQYYINVLLVYPRHRLAYNRVSFLEHEILFNYQQAFELNQLWLRGNPDDLSDLSDFAEKHFTTGRFEECEKRILSLLANEKLDVGIKIALRVIEIANLLALNRACDVTNRMNELINVVSSQRSDFRVEWTFEGTKHFLSQNKKMAANRDWLKQLFIAVEAGNREAILAGLRAASSAFSCSR